MIKKAIIAGTVLVGMAVLLFGTEAYSYVKTYGRRVQSAVKNAVPLDVELERSRQAVAELLPDIRQNMHVVAEEEVEVDQLRKSITEAKSALSDQYGKIMAVRNDLARTDANFHYAGRTYNRDQVKTDLARRFERFKYAEDVVKSKEQILAARQKSLYANREKLDNMIVAKKDLEVQVENLEAKLSMVQAAQSSSDMQFDDSQLSHAKSLIGNLRKRLDVAQRLLDSEGKFTDLIPLDEPVDDDIVEQIDAHFGTQATESIDESSSQAAYSAPAL